MFGKKKQSGLEQRVTSLESQIEALNELYLGVAKSHAKEIKRVSDLQEKLRLMGRKKVRRRDPVTGRFNWLYPEEIGE